MTLSELREALVLELDAPTAERVLAILCRVAPGDRLYIPERPVPVAVEPHDSPRDIQRRYGVSRATAYNSVQRFRR